MPNASSPPTCASTPDRRDLGNPIYTAVSEAMLGWLKTYHGEMLIWTGKENTRWPKRGDHFASGCQ